MIQTIENQEEFFKKVRERWPKWSVRRASGYVAGVMDGYIRDEPQRELRENYILGDPYAAGYFRGFTDAAGEVMAPNRWWLDA